MAIPQIKLIMIGQIAQKLVANYYSKKKTLFNRSIIKADDQAIDEE